jgi:hypothetical protein
MLIHALYATLRVTSVHTDFGKDSQLQPNKIMATKKSGIHIKESHKGRFTAIKKKTGKTTAELKKSSNPAVRKMATFAQNAAKWHHTGRKSK